MLCPGLLSCLHLSRAFYPFKVAKDEGKRFNCGAKGSRVVTGTVFCEDGREQGAYSHHWEW